MRRKVPTHNRQSGQTLIETLVGIFILVTGLISAIGLAIYSFNSTDNTSKQVVATSLAREGLEAVKNARDTNWLNDTLVDCSSNLGTGQMCYANWQGTGSTKLNGGSYAIDFTTSGGAPAWVINKNPSGQNYTLNYDSTTGQYHNQGSGVLSAYSRIIHITEYKVAPYTNQNPRLDVDSTVWWTGKKCPAATDPSTVAKSCKVTLTMHLTNWKNY